MEELQIGEMLDVRIERAWTAPDVLPEHGRKLSAQDGCGPSRSGCRPAAADSGEEDFSTPGTADSSSTGRPVRPDISLRGKRISSALSRIMPTMDSHLSAGERGRWRAVAGRKMPRAIHGEGPLDPGRSVSGAVRGQELIGARYVRDEGGQQVLGTLSAQCRSSRTMTTGC
jgi:hypothetical protein